MNLSEPSVHSNSRPKCNESKRKTTKTTTTIDGLYKINSKRNVCNILWKIYDHDESMTYDWWVDWQGNTQTLIYVHINGCPPPTHTHTPILLPQTLIATTLWWTTNTQQRGSKHHANPPSRTRKSQSETPRVEHPILTSPALEPARTHAGVLRGFYTSRWGGRLWKFGWSFLKNWKMR